jgi:NADH-quinone oxidoreductase subunit J
MTDLVFYVLAGSLICLSVLVVSVSNLLHAAISLIGSFFVTAAIYLLFHMEFVALAQVMVYIGGIVIFMVITILLTSQLGAKNLFPKTAGQRLWGILVCGTLLATLIRVGLSFETANSAAHQAAEPASLGAVGSRILSTGSSGFIVPFEIVSLLLLIALVGAVVIARKEEKA